MPKKNITVLTFNIILIRLAGASGVAAITILLYGQFLFNAFYMGLSIRVSPVIGFQYGVQQRDRLRNTYNIIMRFTFLSSIVMVILSVLGSGPIVSVFTKDPETFQLASTGFRIFAVTLFPGHLSCVISLFSGNHRCLAHRSGSRNTDPDPIRLYALEVFFQKRQSDLLLIKMPASGFPKDRHLINYHTNNTLHLFL